MNHWLIKSEPDVFSIHDLAKAKNKTGAAMVDAKSGDDSLLFLTDENLRRGIEADGQQAGVVELAKDVDRGLHAWWPPGAAPAHARAASSCSEKYAWHGSQRYWTALFTL